MKIAYIVQDLSDPATARRVSMLRAGGAEVALYGFRRTEGVPASVSGVTPKDLGRTSDGKLLHRALAVAERTLTVGKWGQGFIDADVIVARNLESLLLGFVARKRFKSRARLVYELLDVHSIMVGNGAVSKSLRGIEAYLLARCDMVLVSSPAFARDYLANYYQSTPQALLIENKVYGVDASSPTPRAAGPPWRIGWFGGIRCRRSLEVLSTLTNRHPGLLEVQLRGRFANTDLGDVRDLLGKSPGMSYLGPYKNPDDLAGIYGGVHFAWAIDFYEEGANSSWLLPNRLYESALFGAIPIALCGVETGRWLASHDVGLQVGLPLEDSVDRLLTLMTAELYHSAFAALSGLDRSLFRYDDADCRGLIGAIGGAAAPRQAGAPGRSGLQA